MSREAEVRDALDWLGRRTKTLVDKAKQVVDAGGLLQPLTDPQGGRIPRWQLRSDATWARLEALDGAAQPTTDFLAQVMGEGLAAVFVVPPSEVRRWTARLSKYSPPCAPLALQVLLNSGPERRPSMSDRSALASLTLPICWTQPGLAAQVLQLESWLAGLRREAALTRFFHASSRSPEQLSGVAHYLMEAFTLVLAVAEANRKDLPSLSEDDEVMPLTEVLSLLDAWLAEREYGVGALEVGATCRNERAEYETREALGDLAFECLTESTFECAEDDRAWLAALLAASGQMGAGADASGLDELLMRSPSQWVHLLHLAVEGGGTSFNRDGGFKREVRQRESAALPMVLFEATLNLLGLEWVGMLAEASVNPDWQLLWSCLDAETQASRLDEWIFALFMIAVFRSGESA
ncbi:MAG: hypothetical protein IPM37_19915 [Hahellaceae bacterium]|nr:hypothetical protein [Hahellaceae bacterium]